jgi:hypothetical protein
VVLHAVFTENLNYTPPRPLSNDLVFQVLTRRKADLEQRTLDNIDNIDADEEFYSHPEKVIAKVIRMQLLTD